MGILDDLREVESVLPGCPVARAMATMTKEEADALQAALEDVGITSTILTDILVKNGYEIGNTGVGRHRKMMTGERGTKCSCPSRKGN